MSTRRANRTDANHANIVADLRCVPGVSVFDTHDLGKGFPDVAVGYAGKNFFFEIKDPHKPPSRRELTVKEMDFFRMWRGQVVTAETSEFILKYIGVAKSQGY